MIRGTLLLVTTLLTSQSSPIIEITAEPHHHVVFTNDLVRIFNVEMAPGSASLMHWHRHDYISVQLGNAVVSNEVTGRAPVELTLQDGEARFSSAPFAHLMRVRSTQTFRNVTIELLQDDKLRHVPAHWDEDRGLDILQGGTKEILFVKDAVRISEFELQPGGVVPMHHHAGRHLLVAVSDLDLREQFSNAKHPAEVGHLNSGESRWFPASYSHSLTNRGHRPAKFLTLEFP